MIENSKLLEIDNEWGHLIWIGIDSQTLIKETLEFIDKEPVNNKTPK
jgi:hypothetical protein